MHKYLFTYLFTIVLISSIVVPTCLSLCESNYELSIEIDADEESEKTKEIEIKMFAAIDEYATQQQIITTSHIIYFSKSYTSVYLNLDSPPPEVIA